MQQVLTLDLHHMQMEGFFSMTIDNVKASPLLIEAIKEHVRKGREKYKRIKGQGRPSSRSPLYEPRLDPQLAKGRCRRQEHGRLQTVGRTLERHLLPPQSIAGNPPPFPPPYPQRRADRQAHGPGLLPAFWRAIYLRLQSG